MNKPDKLLRRFTRLNLEHWFNRIGFLIGKHSKPIKGSNGLSESSPPKWIAELTTEIHKCMKLPKAVDENIAVSLVLTVLLNTWNFRIMRAKAYDRRRPVNIRKKFLLRSNQYAETILSSMLDESMDAKLFPQQKWDSPFAPKPIYEPDEMELKRQAFNA